MVAPVPEVPRTAPSACLASSSRNSHSARWCNINAPSRVLQRKSARAISCRTLTCTVNTLQLAMPGIRISRVAAARCASCLYTYSPKLLPAALDLQMRRNISVHLNLYNRRWRHLRDRRLFTRETGRAGAATPETLVLLATCNRGVTASIDQCCTSLRCCTTSVPKIWSCRHRLAPPPPVLRPLPSSHASGKSPTAKESSIALDQ